MEEEGGLEGFVLLHRPELLLAIIAAAGGVSLLVHFFELFIFFKDIEKEGDDEDREDGDREEREGDVVVLEVVVVFGFGKRVLKVFLTHLLLTIKL